MATSSLHGIADGLRTRGYYLLPVRELIADQSIVDEMRAKAFEFAEKAERGECWSHPKKPWIPKLYKTDGYMQPDMECPVWRFGMLPEVAQPVKDFCGEAPVYFAANLWCNLPGRAGKHRELSETWHRDPEANLVVKVFWFFEDVDNEAGPMQFVPATIEGDWQQKLCPVPNAKPKDWQGNPIELTDDCIETFTCPADSVLFVVTSALHRGGYTGTKRRLCGSWCYAK